MTFYKFFITASDITACIYTYCVNSQLLWRNKVIKIKNHTLYVT